MLLWESGGGVVGCCVCVCGCVAVFVCVFVSGCL